jgi:K+ transporter
LLHPRTGPKQARHGHHAFRPSANDGRARSVLSALEGLKEPLPAITPYILPLVVAILVGLFALQSQGTARTGRMFGPIMIVWFLSIGLLGLVAVVAHPGVLRPLGGEVDTIVLYYGCMEHPNNPRALEACKDVADGLEFDVMQTSFFFARESIGAASSSALNVLQRQLFIAMHRNAQAAAAFFRIPPNRMVELGSRIEI